MGCCPGSTAPLSERHRLKVHYTGGRALIVKGPATGKEYRFSGSDRFQFVDPRDAVAIVRNSLFRIDGVVELPLADGEHA